ncbi:hypothetical protein PIB30_032244 [Stylosanthes scabra]|uniref:RNase H type-1 domain-containing protein n=1 Tax=Stylosanthes scabra TaxID=79078 RepID=A0ABU6VA53_9FABA|nr:hypothetical protein [Stylosanthes scabra]
METINERTTGEAILGSVEGSLQFILEVVGLKEKNIVFIIDVKNIVDWILGKIRTSWKLRMLRSKTHMVKQVFQNCTVKHMHNGEYKHKKRWVDLAANKTGQWTHWE